MQEKPRHVRGLGRDESEPTSNDRFDQQMISRTCYTNTDAKVELPVWSEVVIDRGHKLLLLLVQRIKASDVSRLSVVLKAHLELSRGLIAGLEVWRKSEALPHAGTMPGTFQGWIERQIPTAELFIYNWPDLPSPCVSREYRTLIAYFSRKANSHWPFPRIWNAHPRTDVISDPLVTLPWSSAREDVESRFEPGVPTLRDLDSFV